MGVYGLTPAGDPFPAFCRAFENCVQAWGTDPAYRDARFQIEQAIRELSLLEASPGQRAAREALSPVNTGQEPTPARQAPSEAYS